MKKLVILLMVLVIGCDQEQFEGSGLESLREFTLTPIAGSKVVLNSVDANGEIVIEWSEARSGFDSDVIYTWLLETEIGDFSDPVMSVVSDNSGLSTQVTLTNKQIDDALVALGLSPGDDFLGKWTVSATNGEVVQVADGVVITLTRFIDALAPFELTSPMDGTSVELDKENPSTDLVIAWEQTLAGFGGDVTYEWLADVDGGDFTNPALTLTSDNSGGDATLTMTHQEWEDELDGLGYAEGATASLDWKVVATSGSLILSSTSVFSIDMTRFTDKLDLTLVLNALDTSSPNGQDVYVAGEFGKLGVAEGDWQQPGTNADLKLTYNSDNSRYELALKVPLANLNTSFDYKYFLATSAAPAWNQGEQQLNEGAGNCGGVSNRSVTFDTDGQYIDDEVTVWEGSCPVEAPMKITLTVTENFPAGLDVYVAGDFGFVAWPQPGTDDRLKMRDIGNSQFETYLPVPSGHSNGFKFFLATKDAPSWGQGEQQVNAGMDGCEGVDNRAFSFTGTETVSGTVDVWEGFCPSFP